MEFTLLLDKSQNHPLLINKGESIIISGVDELKQFFSNVRAAVDKTLDELIPDPKIPPSNLHQAIRWSVFAGGKRMRPAILFAAGRTFGVPDNMLVRTAAACEMIHAYSLIHDDLPAMDDDDLRRGKATCHRQFGEATAILAGDALQTLAFKAIANDEGLTSEMRLGLISMLAEASATPDGMVSGQQLDLNAEGKQLTIDEIEQIHRQKTGALITAAAAAGALIGGASESEIAATRQYATRLGLLFQITDDLLDLTQATESIGKTAGKDLAARKATYPSILGVKKTQDIARSIRNDAIAALLPIKKDASLLEQLVDQVFLRTT